MISRFFSNVFCGLALFGSGLALAEALPCPLDPLLDIPANWKMTPDEFEKQFVEGENKLYVWLTKDRSRAKLGRKLYSNAEIDLTVCEGQVPVEEAIVDFSDGRLINPRRK